MEQRKILMIIGDGMGDRPVPELDGKTPLVAARTPTLDELASRGACGMLDPVAPGICAGSDTSHLSLLGYDPYRFYTGRGPLEAAGVGLEPRQGDVAFRCNFSTVEERGGGLAVVDRRAGRITEGTAELAARLDGMRLLDGAVEARFRASVAHRAALVLRGDELGGEVGDVDPHHEGAVLSPTPVLLSEDDPGHAAARRTAAALDEFVRRSHELLASEPVNQRREREGLPPANIALPRGGGLVPRIPPFSELHGLRAGALVEVGLLQGLLGNYLKLDLLDCPGATGGMDTDVAAMARVLTAAAPDYDFLFVNLKAPDLAGHDNAPAEKVRACEMVDELLTGLRPLWEGSVVTVLTADHATPCECADHSGDSVPVVLHGPGVRPDDVRSFNEFACATGSLGHPRGGDLLPLLLNLANRYTKFGA